jgi:hypothetical protein
VNGVFDVQVTFDAFGLQHATRHSCLLVLLYSNLFSGSGRW